MKATKTWALTALIGMWMTHPPTAPAACLGDHDGNGVVSINELIVSVDNALTGCVLLPRFVDNDDGTVIDNDTRLTWEKKVNADGAADVGNLHDADNAYWWSGYCSSSVRTCQPNPAAAAACAAGSGSETEGCSVCGGDEGTCTFNPAGVMTAWDWLAQLDSGMGFAGHTDWRLPTRVELQSIAGDETSPCLDVDVGFDACEVSLWSATTLASAPNQAWGVLSSGAPFSGYKASSLTSGGSHGVLAVRGGPLVDGQCLGDHDRDGAVGISELIASIDRALNGCNQTPRFVDNGDGTIGDRDTGLMWEKKVRLDSAQNSASLHDADNTYAWAGYCSASATARQCQTDPAAAMACSAGVDGDPDGCSACAEGEGPCNSAATTVWHWLAELNSGAGFAGHADWRLPTRGELTSIVDYNSSTQPAVDPVFLGSRCAPECPDLADPDCSCTDPHTYWSATSSGDSARVVDFANGAVRSDPKLPEFPSRVRAVRSAS